MRGGAGSFRAAVVLGMVAAAGLGGRSARAQQACLGAPNAPTPPGSHWYYRTDTSTGRKCWYVRALDQAAAPAPSQKQANVPIQAKSVGKAAPALAAPDPSAWMDPVEQLDGTNLDWSAPAAPASPADTVSNHGGQPTTNPSSPQPTIQSLPVVPTAQAAGSLPSTTAKRDSAGETASGSNGPVVHVASAAGKPPVSRSQAAAAITVAGLLGLLIVGMFLRWMIGRAFGGRREIKLGRKEPRLVEGVTAKRSLPTPIRQSPSLVPGRDDTSARIHEVEESLRNFARRLQQRRSNSPHVFARMGARGRF